MSDTPRTYAAMERYRTGDNAQYQIPVGKDDMAILERELAVMTAEVEAWRNKPIVEQLREHTMEVTALRTKLDSLLTAKNKALEALKSWVACEYPVNGKPCGYCEVCNLIAELENVVW
jgi:hypothetical protein